MILLLSRIQNCINKKRVLIKKRNRIVKIKIKSRNLWVSGFNKEGGLSLVLSEKEALEYNFIQALRATKEFSTEIEFHFKDNFGSSRAKISEYDDESIYNCTSVIFDTKIYGKTI